MAPASRSLIPSNGPSIRALGIWYKRLASNGATGTGAIAHKTGLKKKLRNNRPIRYHHVGANAEEPLGQDATGVGFFSSSGWWAPTCDKVSMSMEGELIGLWLLSKGLVARSEERRVGKECRSRWSPYH